MANDVTEGEVRAAEGELNQAAQRASSAEAALQSAESSYRAAQAVAYAAASSPSGHDYGIGQGADYGLSARQNELARAQEDSRAAQAALAAALERARSLLQRCEDAERRLKDAQIRVSQDAGRKGTAVVRSREEEAAREFWEVASKARGWADRLAAAIARASRATPTTGAPHGTPSFGSSASPGTGARSGYHAGSSSYGGQPSTYASAFSSGYQGQPAAEPGGRPFSTASPLEERLHHTPYAYATRGQELPRRPAAMWSTQGPGPGGVSPGYGAAASPAAYSTPVTYRDAPFASDLESGQEATLEQRLPDRIGTAIRTMTYMLNLGYHGRYGA